MLLNKILSFLKYLKEGIIKRDKKVIIGLMVTILVLLFVFMRMSSSRVAVETAKVERGNILTTVSASGIVDSRSVNLGAAQMAGRVDWIGVSEGGEVKAGQILVKLNGYNQARKEYLRIKELHQNGFASDLELERAKTAVENASISAPFSGIVTAKDITPGESISPGVPVITVVEMKNPWLEIQIDEVDIAKVKLGQRVQFTTDAFQDEKFYGQITWINDKAELKKVGGRVRMDEEDLVFRAKAKFEDGSNKLRPGMSVYAEVIAGEKKDVLVVPREAVTLREGKQVVYAINGGRVKQVEVEVGDKDMEKVEILSGLTEGQRVAVSNLEKLRDRTRIKVVKKK